MEESLKFNSQICTTKEQSQRLLDLGLKPETADMYFNTQTGIIEVPYSEDELVSHLGLSGNIPAWSLHRLIAFLPETVGEKYEYFALYHASVRYGGIIHDFSESDNLYDNIIDCIEWLIKEGYFNKEYLKQ